MKKIGLFLLFLISSISFAAQPNKEQPLTVILNGFPNANHAPLIIAQQKGFFKEQGLNVNLIGPTFPRQPTQLVVSGKADIAISNEPLLLQQIDHGMPLIRIGALIDKPLSCLVALKETGVTTITDLKGKEIGVNTYGLSGIMLKTMLEKQGLKNKDVALINVRYNLTQALLSRHVKVVNGMMRNVEVPILELNEHKLTTFFPEEYGVPTYDELIFVSNIKHIHDDRFPRFLAAVKKAVRYMDEHPQQAWQIFATKFPELETATNMESWFATMPYFAEDPANFNSAEWKKFAEYLQKNGRIKQVQPSSRYGVVLEKQT